MKRQQTKIYKQENSSQSEGGLLELLVFAFLFVVVFSVLARTAQAAEAKNSKKVALRAAAVGTNSPNEITPVDPNSAAPLARQGQNVAVPTGALPESNVRAGIPEPETAKRIAWTSKVIVETTEATTDESKVTMGGWYQLSTGLTDQKRGISATLKLGWAQEYSYQKDDNTNGDLDNPAIILSKVWKNKEDFRSNVFDSLTLGLSGSVGASREAAHRTFIAGIGPSMTAAKQLGKLHVGESLAYSRGFYGYDIRNDGKVNAPNVFTSITEASFDLTPTLALSASMKLSQAISFQNVGRTTQLTAASLDYSALENLAVSLGFATERGTSNEDGQGNSVKFFDRNVSQAVLDLIFRF